MDTIKTLQVVGYKNSGKTTLIENWLEVLTEENLTISVMKHHGHGGPLEMPASKTDSIKFLNKGASSSLAVGDNMLQFHLKKELSFQQLLSLSKLANPDIILIEGFKHELEPKVVIVRTKEDWETLRKLKNIVLVITEGNVDLNIDYRVIKKVDKQSLDCWIIDYMVNKLVDI